MPKQLSLLSLFRMQAESSHDAWTRNRGCAYSLLHRIIAKQSRINAGDCQLTSMKSFCQGVGFVVGVAGCLEAGNRASWPPELLPQAAATKC